MKGRSAGLGVKDAVRKRFSCTGDSGMMTGRCAIARAGFTDSGWAGALHVSAAAGGRNDAVHAQVFDHLAVVIHEVGEAEGGLAGAGAVVGLDERVVGGDAVDVGVGLREGVFEGLHDFRLSFKVLESIALGLGVGFAGTEEVVVG